MTSGEALSAHAGLGCAGRPDGVFRLPSFWERVFANAAKSFMVKSVNKAGSISRMTPTKPCWHFDAFATVEEAEARRMKLEELNPGRRFAVVAL